MTSVKALQLSFLDICSIITKIMVFEAEPRNRGGRGLHYERSGARPVQIRIGPEGRAHDSLRLLLTVNDPQILDQWYGVLDSRLPHLPDRTSIYIDPPDDLREITEEFRVSRNFDNPELVVIRLPNFRQTGYPLRIRIKPDRVELQYPHELHSEVYQTKATRWEDLITHVVGTLDTTSETYRESLPDREDPTVVESGSSQPVRLFTPKPRRYFRQRGGKNKVRPWSGSKNKFPKQLPRDLEFGTQGIQVDRKSKRIK